MGGKTLTLVGLSAAFIIAVYIYSLLSHAVFEAQDVGTSPLFFVGEHLRFSHLKSGGLVGVPSAYMSTSSPKSL